MQDNFAITKLDNLKSLLIVQYLASQGYTTEVN